MSENIRLTDEAYEGLQALIIDLNYNQRGISKFLGDCASAKIQWSDTRPEDIRNLIDDKPIWSTGDGKHPHRLGPLPINYLLEIASIFNIASFKRQNIMLNGPSIRNQYITKFGIDRTATPFAIITAVIEAIGIKWLSLSAGELARLPTINRFKQAINLCDAAHPVELRLECIRGIA